MRRSEFSPSCNRALWSPKYVLSCLCTWEKRGLDREGFERLTEALQYAAELSFTDLMLENPIRASI